ncbi:TIGR00730 family Rossman fold protein [Dyadobacter flavalbus]|uniref:Cytokinin riboside 5'-monophosphate phosphoribohydrolase n=1 Tax=Dyadobacter flavalbus TaxID=2579942 RepID=A0A5M8QZ00_9BACT|nr:TIGR00730 family Rossman fold protein [Dyadobacter flavalbus]KAA6440280.1 TIGR00730 family Rossman fold protein [Dyadobacter flavalbus]
MQSIVVYCGSNHGNKPVYAESAYALGEELARRNIKLVYGGGNMGLMGRVADGAMVNNGSVTGIIPNFLAKLEVAHKTLTELHFVDTMHERKAKMVSLSDGVIALPGGYGTFDELFEILTWSQLRIFNGPVGLLNINGYYDLLLLQLDKMVEEGFLHAANRDLLVVAADPVTLLEKMEAFRLASPENKPLDNSLYIDNK